MPTTAPTPRAWRVLVRPALLLLHLAGVLAVTAALWLGWWQIGAWQGHREDRAAAIADADPVPLDSALGPDEAFSGEHVGRPVEARGRWLPDVLHVDERRRTSDPSSADGLWRVSLLQTCAAPADEQDRCDPGPVVPVVLGWTPEVSDDVVPGSPGEVVDLTGWLQPSEAVDSATGPVEGDVLPSLTTADLLGRVPGDVYSGYLILRTPESLRGDLVAVTPDSLPDPPASTALRNLFYGIEWWVFAAFAAYLWFQWSRDAVRRAQGREGGTGTSPGGSPPEREPVASSA